MDGEGESSGAVGKSSLWNEDEKNFLEDVTLNLVNDDDEMLQHMKGKTVMKWDSQKKRYVTKKIDAERKVIKEKRNEAGVKITNKNAEKTNDQQFYKKWMQRTHLKLQNAGEVEDTKAIERAKTSNDSRRMMK